MTGRNKSAKYSHTLCTRIIVLFWLDYIYLGSNIKQKFFN